MMYMKAIISTILVCAFVGATYWLVVCVDRLTYAFDSLGFVLAWLPIALATWAILAYKPLSSKIMRIIDVLLD